MDLTSRTLPVPRGPCRLYAWTPSLRRPPAIALDATPLVAQLDEPFLPARPAARHGKVRPRQFLPQRAVRRYW